jgi:DNA adenine methylase
MQPVIKWTGSKRSQAEQIISLMPKEIDTYYEPFVGGGSVFAKLIEYCDEGKIKVNRFVLSDLNKELILMFMIIKHYPHRLIEDYTARYNQIASLSTEAERNAHFVNIRNNYNKISDKDPIRPYVFYWLLRTCFNGLIRYNRNGEFNTAYHPTRLGMKPEKLAPIILEWSMLMNKYNVELVHGDYKDVIGSAKENDFVYMDPPYAKSVGMYFAEEFNKDEMFEFINKLPCKWALSYDGTSGKENNTFDIPKHIYKTHKYLNASYSSFKKIVKQEDAKVFDSIYLNY